MNLVKDMLGMSLLGTSGFFQPKYWDYTPYIFKRDPEVDELLKNKAQAKRDRKNALRLKHYTGARS